MPTTFVDIFTLLLIHYI